MRKGFFRINDILPELMELYVTLKTRWWKKIQSVRIIILHDPVSWYFNVLVTGQGQNYIFFSHRKFTIEQINQTLWSAITSRTHLRCDPWNNREIPSYEKNLPIFLTSEKER